MPTELENAKLMLLCLQYSSATTFNYKKIAEICGISTAAASKRMSRLKQAVKAGKETNVDVRYLWICIQNSDMKDIDFAAIGKEIGLKSGTASKRWSRLKQALERGETGATASTPEGAGAGKEGTGGKKAAGGGMKRKNPEVEDSGEASGKDAKKGKKSAVTAATSEIKLEDRNISGELHFGDTTEDDRSTVIPDGKPVTTKKQPALKKAATTGPKKPAATIVERKSKSAPRARALTDKEIYAKLEVDEAEAELQSFLPGQPVYPKKHALLETFQALRTPGKDDASDKSSSLTAPKSSPFGLPVGLPPYPAPVDGTHTMRTASDAFTAIGEKVMSSASGAEECVERKQDVEQEPCSNSGQSLAINLSSPWYSVPQGLPNPFIDDPRIGNESFFADDEPDEGKEYI